MELVTFSGTHNPARHRTLGWARWGDGRIVGVAVCFRGRLRVAMLLPGRPGT